ncbi:MAG: corrinoid protein [archaeon]|nr:corrinoid protein [archaeon]
MAFEAESKVLFDAMVAVKLPGIVDAVNKAKDAGMPATDIINAMSSGMTEVGVMFQRGKLFLPHVLSAAAGMNKAMEILGPELAKSGDAGAAKKGTAVMGTVEGDVHDIGKSICSTMLQCAGFDVHDLGRDVPKAKFIEEIKAGCNFCGMSALMTTTMTVMKEIIDMAKAEGIRDKVCMMVGGAPITQAYADKIGADVYGETANDTVAKAKEVAA